MDEAYVQPADTTVKRTRTTWWTRYVHRLGEHWGLHGYGHYGEQSAHSWAARYPTGRTVHYQITNYYTDGSELRGPMHEASREVANA